MVEQTRPPIKYIVWFEDGSSLAEYGTEEELSNKYPTAIKIEEA